MIGRNQRVPIRIYSLAKELKLDSKELVELCAKAGISGKGSALASLSDDESAKLRSYLSGASKAAPRKAAAPVRPKKEPDKIPVATLVTPETEAPVRPSAPGAAGGKIKVLGSPTKKSSETDSPKRQPLKGRGPVIKLAAVPKSGEAPPPPPTETEQPKAQKPVIKLPADAIRNAKSGTSAPLEQFTRQTEKKRSDGEKPSGTTDGRKTRGRAAPADSASDKPARGRRRGKEVPAAEEGERGKRLAGMASARAARGQPRRGRKGLEIGGDDGRPVRRRRRSSKVARSTAAPRKEKVALELPCSVRTFSEAAGVQAVKVITSLAEILEVEWRELNINSAIEDDIVDMLLEEYGVEVELKQQESVEDAALASIHDHVDDPDSLVTRPPVVTFLGHVDHGKTSLLDAIIGIDVVTGEAGGITQHIRAYTVEKEGKKIAFVDTPGHEAFTEMRARGANVTDIAVLVVAADDGVMPQTEEAISHARAAEVPIVVALNKIDLPGADINRAMQTLSTNGLLPQEWGGDTEVVQTSAITGAGLDDLLETLLLTAEVHEYKANPNRPATGVCLEAEQESGRGAIAKVIVQNGTLRVGDVLVCGQSHGRVKAMYNTLRTRRKIKEAPPSTTVNVTGFNEAPSAGETFYVLDDIAVARQIAEDRSHHAKTRSLGGRRVHISFEEFQEQLEEGRLGDSNGPSILNLIIRADVRGSIEAIEKELSRFEHPEVQIKVLQAAVGGITVADITLADASDAVVVGFNVIPDEAARKMADERGVEIRRYQIIYKLTEEIKLILEGKLQPEKRDKELGRALVQRVFTISKVGAVAGCRVLAGTIERGCRIRINRDGRGIGDYALDSLRREKNDIKETREGTECGIKVAGFNDLKEGDILEAYKIEEIARTL